MTDQPRLDYLGVMRDIFAYQAYKSGKNTNPSIGTYEMISRGAFHLEEGFWVEFTEAFQGDDTDNLEAMRATVPDHGLTTAMVSAGADHPDGWFMFAYLVKLERVQSYSDILVDILFVKTHEAGDMVFDPAQGSVQDLKRYHDTIARGRQHIIDGFTVGFTYPFPPTNNQNTVNRHKKAVPSQALAATLYPAGDRYGTPQFCWAYLLESEAD